ncbi:hypothetical protein BDU57DRAFT_262335 [Ampelomyces quisqualis]|uniref:Uncharacterized protein n=1 Tax=Ampelomyces quisqualis TaxID=50730 RepID=A0A6A5QK70_AMPQU|nr:hypothetical protein BDU57DRAFT_262335 [Ampelomyces quisqualis]
MTSNVTTVQRGEQGTWQSCAPLFLSGLATTWISDWLNTWYKRWLECWGTTQSGEARSVSCSMSAIMRAYNQQVGGDITTRLPFRAFGCAGKWSHDCLAMLLTSQSNHFESLSYTTRMSAQTSLRFLECIPLSGSMRLERSQRARSTGSRVRFVRPAMPRSSADAFGTATQDPHRLVSRNKCAAITLSCMTHKIPWPQSLA